SSACCRKQRTSPTQADAHPAQASEHDEHPAQASEHDEPYDEHATQKSGEAHNCGNVPCNSEDYIHCLHSRASAGDEAAQMTLGFRYANGQRVPQDVPRAIEWYQRAADQGNTEALLNISEIYRYGRGIERDIPRAVSYLESAA